MKILYICFVYIYIYKKKNHINNVAAPNLKLFLIPKKWGPIVQCLCITFLELRICVQQSLEVLFSLEPWSLCFVSVLSKW